MPTTYNGIGTHYYGKKDLTVRTAPCRFCHRAGPLKSYETRLWFVVVFIPVIPLGRKRIIDECPSCTRHMAADADAYEQARQLQTSACAERFRRDPSPEAAIEAHGMLLAFHEHEQAAAFRRDALARYPEHAELRTTMAAQLNSVSSYDESAKLFEEALAIDPDLTDARVGVARRKMALGELDEARALLDFLELPGAGEHEDLGPIDTLSVFYQRQGRHEEALSLAEHLLRELPRAGHQHPFRKFVRTSEKALGRAESILPPLEHSLGGVFRSDGSPYPPWLRWLVAGTAALGLLSAGLLINNEYIRRHRTVHVLNALGPPVQVRVDGGPAQAVSGLGRITVTEGRHRLQLSGPVNESHDVEVRDDFFGRWFKKPVWVLIPGGEGVLQESTVTYAENPPPSDHRTVLGKSFVAVPNVDYAFESPPDHMRVDRKQGQVVKTVVQRFPGNDTQAFLSVVGHDREAALSFAERRLRRNPGQDDLLRAYLHQIRAGDAPRVVALAGKVLDDRPVRVLWHRAYQTFSEVGGNQKALVAAYDRLLAAEPSNGALLYLRGRIEPDRRKHEGYFRRAIDADPKLPWPWLALGAQAEAEGRWEDCLKDLRKALELKIDPDEIAERLHVARLAKGEAADLVREYRGQLASHPHDPKVILNLCEALAASGQADQVLPAAVSWLTGLPASWQGQLAGPLRAVALYEAGKLDECEQQTRADNAQVLRAQALAALGRASEATSPPFPKDWEDPWASLAVSLGLSLEGKPDEAAGYRDRACRKLETLTDEARRASRILGAAEPPPDDDLKHLFVDPEEKALMYAVLAERFPDRKADYLASAARFNVRRAPPYLLVLRAVEGKAPPTP